MNKEYAALPLRLILGLAFIVHGYAKLFGGIPATTEFFSGVGIPLAGFFAYVVSILEFFGGIALILGFFVSIISILLSVDMLVAILLVHLPRGFLASNGGYEFALIILSGLVTLAMLGSGKLSLQKVFKR